MQRWLRPGTHSFQLTAWVTLLVLSFVSQLEIYGRYVALRHCIGQKHSSVISETFNCAKILVEMAELFEGLSAQGVSGLAPKLRRPLCPSETLANSCSKPKSKTIRKHVTWSPAQSQMITEHVTEGVIYKKSGKPNQFALWEKGIPLNRHIVPVCMLALWTTKQKGDTMHVPETVANELILPGLQNAQQGERELSQPGMELEREYLS